MHRKSLLWHIFLPFLTITLLTLLLVSGYASRVMRNFHLEHTGENLVARSSLFAQQIQPLVADGEHEVHDWMPKPSPIEPVEFEVPKVATSDGDLTLSCWAEPGRGGPGRGCQIGELWLIKR